MGQDMAAPEFGVCGRGAMAVLSPMAFLAMAVLAMAVTARLKKFAGALK